MYPYNPLPHHVMALHIVAVVSYLALFCQVGADILVYRDEFPMVERAYDDVPARFGDSLPLNGLKGLVVYANPANACSPIDPPPEPRHIRLPAKQWVVLIRRYDCTFEEKVRNAQNANYSAAIIHNVNASDLVFSDIVPLYYGWVDQHTGFQLPTLSRKPMSANNPDGIHIPSVFITEDAGVELHDRYLWNMGYYVIINDDLPFNINTHLLLPFAIVVGICFLIMLVFVIVKCVKDRRRQRRHRLPSSQLKKIPTSKFSKNDPYETCAICLEDYQVGEKLRLLPCSHAYHCKCIDPWLTRNRRVCPVCKRKVFADDERNSDSESDTDTDDTSPLLGNNANRGGTGGGTFTTRQLNPGETNILNQLLQDILASTSTDTSNNAEQMPNEATTSAESTHPSFSSRFRKMWDSISVTSSSSGSQYSSPQSEHQGEANNDEDDSRFNFISSGEHSINQNRLDQSGSQVALLGSQEDEVTTAGPSGVTSSTNDGTNSNCVVI